MQWIRNEKKKNKSILERTEDPEKQEGPSFFEDREN
jgi:hypothetical protein